MSPAAGTTSRPPRLDGPPRPDLRRELARRRAGRRTLVTAALSGVVLVLAGVVAWLVWASSVLATEQVRVRGESELSASAVRQAAAVPLGVPLARQDLDAIARRAATLPQVASASVTRDWPHTLVVAVVERQPVVALRDAGGGYALVDAQGVAFETSRSVPDGVVLAEADPVDREALGALGTVAAALPGSLARRVVVLRAASADDITLNLSSGTRVRWGDASDSPLKAQVVAALLERHPRAIDVSAPHTPATR